MNYSAKNDFLPQFLFSVFFTPHLYLVLQYILKFKVYLRTRKTKFLKIVYFFLIIIIKLK